MYYFRLHICHSRDYYRHIILHSVFTLVSTFFSNFTNLVSILPLICLYTRHLSFGHFSATATLHIGIFIEFAFLAKKILFFKVPPLSSTFISFMKLINFLSFLTTFVVVNTSNINSFKFFLPFLHGGSAIFLASSSSSQAGYL